MNYIFKFQLLLSYINLCNISIGYPILDYKNIGYRYRVRISSQYNPGYKGVHSAMHMVNSYGCSVVNP